MSAHAGNVTTTPRTPMTSAAQSRVEVQPCLANRSGMFVVTRLPLPFANRRRDEAIDDHRAATDLGASADERLHDDGAGLEAPAAQHHGIVDPRVRVPPGAILDDREA